MFIKACMCRLREPVPASRRMKDIPLCTGWAFRLRLCQTSKHQNKSCFLVHGPPTKMKLLFWWREVWHNLNGHPVHIWFRNQFAAIFGAIFIKSIESAPRPRAMATSIRSRTRPSWSCSPSRSRRRTRRARSRSARWWTPTRSRLVSVLFPWG